MLSPDSFVRSHKRHVTDVIRVSLEKHGILGFIEIHEGMTLLEARTLIWENVEHAPCDFQFVLDDGVPVSARQEHTQKILHFYPCVKIRECKKPPVPTAMANPLSPGRQSSVGSASSVYDSSSDVPQTAMASGSSSVSGTTERISIWTSSGDEFAVWISEDYTFQQLRKDGARYWHLPAAQVALVDSEGCLWPEQAKVLSVMSVEELLQRKIILESKAGASAASSTSRTKPPTEMRRRTSAFSATMAASPSFSPASRQSRTLSSWKELLSPTKSTKVSADAVENPVEELWRVFTFYCVTGDSLELECIKAHQFNKLLRDARVLGATVTPAMAHIIYTSETKGKPQASGKMNYDEFLNALVKIALARQRKSSSRHLQRSVDTQEEDELFQRLVMDNILPLASRWPTHLWDQHTQLLRTPEIVGFASKFLESLLDIYMFYAKSHLLSSSNGVKEFYLSYADYQRFVNDFAFANLQISSVEAAQVFLAACSSAPFHEAFKPHDPDDPKSFCEPLLSPGSPLQRRFSAAQESLADPTNSTDAGCDLLSCSSSSSVPPLAVAVAFQRIVDTAEGVVLFSFPAAQVGRICMSFSAFLDALGRLGLTSFAKTKTVRPLQSVKAVFHHLSRGLTRSRVLDIVQNHGSSSMHSGRFYSGSVAFNNKFLDMWRYEGSPDYLTGCGAMDLAADKSGSAAMIAMGNAGAHQPSGASKALTATTPLSPSRRLTSSAAMFDERVVTNGAGRGREALDRLVRDAFIRNAVNSNAVAASSAASAPSKDDAVTPGSPTERRTFVRDESATTPEASLTSNKNVHRTPPPAPLSVSVTDSESGEDQANVSPVQAVVSSQEPKASDSRQSTMEAMPVRTYMGGGGAALHPDDQKALYESILLKGGVFKKYGQWGNPHRRFVWCSKEFDGVYWRPINKKHSLSKEGISVGSFLAVLPGNSNRTRYAFMKHLSDEKSLCRCFSLVAEDRRLDLEADSEATRDLWVQALMFLMREHRPRTRGL